MLESNYPALKFTGSPPPSPPGTDMSSCDEDYSGSGIPSDISDDDNDALSDKSNEKSTSFVLTSSLGHEARVCDTQLSSQEELDNGGEELLPPLTATVSLQSNLANSEEFLAPRGTHVRSQKTNSTATLIEGYTISQSPDISVDDVTLTPMQVKLIGTSGVSSSLDQSDNNDQDHVQLCAPHSLNIKKALNLDGSIQEAPTPIPSSSMISASFVPEFQELTAAQCEALIVDTDKKALTIEALEIAVQREPFSNHKTRVLNAEKNRMSSSNGAEVDSMSSSSESERSTSMAREDLPTADSCLQSVSKHTFFPSITQPTTNHLLPESNNLLPQFSSSFREAGDVPTLHRLHLPHQISAADMLGAAVGERSSFTKEIHQFNSTFLPQENKNAHLSVQKQLPVLGQHQEQVHQLSGVAFPLSTQSGPWHTQISRHNVHSDQLTPANSLPRASFASVGSISRRPSSTRRSVHLRLMEEDRTTKFNENRTEPISFLRSLSRRARSLSHPLPNSLFAGSHESPNHTGRDSSKQNQSTDAESDFVSDYRIIERGIVVLSWYEGTSTKELQDHLKRSVRRKLGHGPNIKLEDMRLLDENVKPFEDIVLSPFLPDGSIFRLQFTTKDVFTKVPHPTSTEMYTSGPPDTPSAAPSPRSSSLDLVKLQQQIKGMLTQPKRSCNRDPLDRPADRVDQFVSGTFSSNEILCLASAPATPRQGSRLEAASDEILPPILENGTEVNRVIRLSHPQEDSQDSDSRDPNELVAEKLRQLNEILLLSGVGDKHIVKDPPCHRNEEKRHAIFVSANYLVLFLSIIAISAEINERAPRWMDWINKNVHSVRNCAANRDALFECVTNGDFSGLVASILIWATQSAATKQLFLFGFDSPKKLWTVVYEAGVTAICWGISYMLIRRGLNPDTRTNFWQKYWKDAVYGSLAGFNAAFMKAVLKNLIPQEQVLDVLDNRQLSIVNWFGKLFARD